MQRKLSSSRDFLIRNIPWPTLPSDGPVILIADALIERIRDAWYTVYFITIRRASETEAFLAKPVISSCTESQLGWKTAFDTLDLEILKNVAALVCDGHIGMVNYAKQSGWIIQRCHYHLLKAIQGRRSRFGSLKHGNEGAIIHNLVKIALSTKDKNVLKKAIVDIEGIALSTSSKEYRKILRGFITNVEDFKSYLYHPGLHLPTTNNAAESLVGVVRDMLRRLRGCASIDSFRKWIFALIKFKKKITCNGFHQPN